MPHKFFSLNVEGNRHIDRFMPFLESRRPEIIFLQEVLEFDLPSIASALSMHAVFAPMQGITPSFLRGEYANRMGVALLSRFPLSQVRRTYYGSFFEGTPDRIRQEIEGEPASRHCILLTAATAVNGKAITLGCTHMTWTPTGQPNDGQRYNAERLLANLQDYPEILLCGDFNAPRGYDVFDRIAQVYKDNVPSDVITSIDPALHKAGPLQLMVDGVFSTPGYSVTNVRLHTGLSDHQGVSGEIEVL